MPLDEKQKEALERALAAVKMLGQQIVSAELQHSLLGQFFKMLADYQKNKAAFQVQVAREARAKKLSTSANSKQDSKKIADPDLTVISNIKAFINKAEDVKALREQLQSKIVSEEAGEWDQPVSPAEKANSAWRDLLALVNQISPEPVVVIPIESSESGGSLVSTEDDAKLAARLQEEERNDSKANSGGVVPAPIPQRQDQLIGGNEDELFGVGVLEVNFLSVLEAVVDQVRLDEAKQLSLQQEQVRRLVDKKAREQEEANLRKTIGDSKKEQSQREQEQKEREKKEEKDLKTALALSQPQTSKKWTPWQWLALFLALCALVCAGALACGVIALATQAAFWIVPLSSALPMTIAAAGLILVLVGGIGYALSSSAKSLKGGTSSGQPLLAHAGNRSDSVTLPPPNSSHTWVSVSGPRPSSTQPPRPGKGPTSIRVDTNR